MILDRLLGVPFNAAPRLFDSVSDLDPSSSRIGVHQVRVRAQPRHSHPSVGFRYRDHLTYATDTAFDHGTAELADGCALLIHEAWLAGSQVSDVHSSGKEAARIARTAGVARLVLAHLDPRVELPRLLAEAQEIFPSTELGVDGAHYALDSA
jgi:ribonuclease BN (tRNA processing enzyme)